MNNGIDALIGFIKHLIWIADNNACFYISQYKICRVLNKIEGFIFSKDLINNKIKIKKTYNSS